MGFKLALGQMTVGGGDIEGNLQRAVRMISAAADAGAKVVLLPEALDAGWTNPNVGGFGSDIGTYFDPARICRAAGPSGSSSRLRAHIRGRAPEV